MLASLEIHNFALIDAIKINFTSGFTVITGETGSGKSILLGALHLILGERANYSVIRSKEKKTIVEAVFHLNPSIYTDFFTLNDIDFSEETIVRREITTQGKSRAFINDTPVSLLVLKEFSEQLIHIHSQHNTLEVKKPAFQMDVLDVLAGTLLERASYRDKYKTYRNIQQKLTSLESEYRQRQLDLDYIQFQLDELDKLNLSKVNYSSIEQELSSFEKMDDIRASFIAISNELTTENEGANVLNNLLLLKSRLDKIRGTHTSLDALISRIHEVVLEVKDIGEESIGLLEHLSNDPEKQAVLTSQLDQYNTLLRKHHLTSQEELISKWNELAQNQEGVEEMAQQLTALKAEQIKLFEELSQLATKLHEARHAAIPSITVQLTDVLTSLKMPDTHLVFDLTKENDLQLDGFSNLKILFTPNKGMVPVALENSASGGELSRLMLSIQYLLSTKKELPTLILDEIDTGVSGDVAQKIGSLLAKMGKEMQLFAITHLPQVAGKGKTHLKVIKDALSGVTTTQVLPLSEEERVEEVARLMSGDDINASAIAHAKALMEN